MKLIETELSASALIARLNNGATNAINLDLLQALDEVILLVEQEDSIRSLVLTSANEKFFSIGFDLPNLIDLKKEVFHTFYSTFNSTCLNLFTCPKPVVAAINGHAVAGGCILALCCDYRFIASGKRLMGLNEIKLGVPVPFLADCILRDLVGSRDARLIMESGDFYLPEQSLQLGMVDQVHPLEALLPAAVEKASMLGTYSPQAYAAIKGNRVEPVKSQIMAGLQAKELYFIERWYDEETRALLKAAVEKY